MNRMMKYAGLAGADALSVVLSLVTAYLYYYRALPSSSDVQQMAIYSAIYAVLFLAAAMRYKLYRRVWQYASIGEMISVLKAVTASSVLAYGLASLASGMLIPLPVAVYTYETSLLLTAGVRFARRVFRNMRLGKKGNRPRVLIVGAGSCGAMIAKDLQDQPAAPYQPVAFVDDDPAKFRQTVHGIPVYGSSKDIPELVRRLRIDEILIAIPSADRATLTSLIDRCKRAGVGIKTASGLGEYITYMDATKRWIEHHLERRDPEQKFIHTPGMDGMFAGKTVLVTGAGGAVGSEISRKIASCGPGALLLLGRGENSIYTIEMELRRRFPSLTLETIIADVKDKQRMEQVFRQYRPQIVFHAAAHRHTPYMENNPSEAVKNNVFGAKNVVDCAQQFGAQRFIHLSEENGDPSSIIGMTGRLAEIYVLAANRRSDTLYSIVRFGEIRDKQSDTESLSNTVPEIAETADKAIRDCVRSHDEVLNSPVIGRSYDTLEEMVSDDEWILTSSATIWLERELLNLEGMLNASPDMIRQKLQSILFTAQQLGQNLEVALEA